MARLPREARSTFRPPHGYHLHLIARPTRYGGRDGHFANGGDNIAVYPPMFAVATIGALSTYAIVFLVGVAVWCVAGKYVASHPVVAAVLERWNHVVVPVVLIVIGVAILADVG